MTKATKIVYGFFGAAWVAFESSGEWVKTQDGEYWEYASDWLDPETGDNREYVLITRNGEIKERKWYCILNEEQRNQINDFANKIKSKI